MLKSISPLQAAWLIFAVTLATIVGAAIIIGAGLYIFLRERELGREETAVNPPVA